MADKQAAGKRVMSLSTLDSINPLPLYIEKLVFPEV